MSKIFISYNRQSEESVKALAEDIEAIGHTTWFDQELSGGQEWWNQILDAIRNCDLIILVLTPETLESEACKREYSYANDLGKPILPMLGADGVSTNLLPPALSQIQFIDYRNQDRAAALRLAKALNTISTPNPLPNPLPDPPEAPLSYLSKLTEQIGTASNLSIEEQSTLVVELKRGLRDPETTADTWTLLNRLKKRRDLFATIAEEIDELLGSKKTGSSTSGIRSAPEPKPEPKFIEEAIHPATADKKLVGLILTAILCGIFTIDYVAFFKFDLFYLQIFTASYIGYRYSPRVAAVSGMLIFLPNLILHMIGMLSIPLGLNETGGNSFETFKGTIFTGTRYLNENLQSRTLGIAFLYYSSFGLAVAIIKKKVYTLLGKSNFLSNDKEQLTATSKIFYIVMVLLLPTTIHFGPGTISGKYILYSLFLLWVYRYGIQQLRLIFLVLLLIHMISYGNDLCILFDNFDYYNFPLLLISLMVCRYFNVNNRRVTQGSVYYFSIFVFCLLTGFSSYITPFITVSFNELALPWFIWMGYKYGSNAAFRAGVIWGCTMSFGFNMSDMLRWGGADIQYIMAAALLGYLGGIDSVRHHFLKAGTMIILIYYCVILVVHLTNYGLTLEGDIDKVVTLGGNLLFLLFLSAFTKRQQQATV